MTNVVAGAAIIPETSIQTLVPTRSEFAERICSHWQDSVQNILEVGRDLTQAKNSLAHGEFEAMVKADLPFSEQTARKLRSIASDERLSNRAHGRDLPASWTSLYELTKLDDEQWVSAMESGAIRPDMERKDITKLRTGGNHRALGTGENEWYTPPEYIEAARNVLGVIELDPASSDAAQQSVNAQSYFTQEDDGLVKDWSGRIWMNPPYAQPYIMQFVEKLCDEYSAQNVTEAIALTHNYTDTRWFQMAASNASAMCFTRGRIGFVDPDGNKAAPTQGQTFFYFGDDVNKFSSYFKQFGFVVSLVSAQEDARELV